MARERTLSWKVLGGWLIVLAIPTAVLAEDEGEEPGIRDNSFLIEEAFNQEPGVVQHIFNWVPSWERDRGHRDYFDFVFTQEWPVFSQQHQFSYTLPISSVYERLPGKRSSQSRGLGDLMLNYRYQALDGNLCGWWAAPRFSVILPTGDDEAGLGNGQTGYQINLPFSKEFQRMAVNFNAGLTITPGVTAGIDPTIAPVLGRDLNGYNLGASAIYFLRPDFHLMLETVALWDEQLAPAGGKERLFQYILSPGFRWALYTHDDTQWVIGAAVPVGLTGDAPDLGAFFYMSFEHRFRPERDAKPDE
jgi:hypothetical protein